MAYTVDEDGKQYRIDAEDVKKIITEQRKDSQTVFWIENNKKSSIWSNQILWSW